MSRNILIISILLILSLCLPGCGSAAPNPVLFQEDFNLGSLDGSHWEVTMDGDFSETVVDVTDVDPGETVDYRLRLRASTIDTTDPLKYLGVRSRDTVDFSVARVVTFDLDWNNQSNGCYLTAALFLCPTISNNPKVEDDWLKFEYVGVPPGKNVRINIWEKVDGAVHPLLTDWGPRDEQDKPLGLPLGNSSREIELFLDKASLMVTQDGEEIFPAFEHGLKFTQAYIYLQMSSGTNYPPREVFFDNVLVQPAKP